MSKLKVGDMVRHTRVPWKGVITSIYEHDGREKATVADDISGCVYNKVSLLHLELDPTRQYEFKVGDVIRFDKSSTPVEGEVKKITAEEGRKCLWIDIDGDDEVDRGYYAQCCEIVKVKVPSC